MKFLRSYSLVAKHTKCSSSTHNIKSEAYYYYVVARQAFPLVLHRYKHSPWCYIDTSIPLGATCIQAKLLMQKVTSVFSCKEKELLHSTIDRHWKDGHAPIPTRSKRLGKLVRLVSRQYMENGSKKNVCWTQTKLCVPTTTTREDPR